LAAYLAGLPFPQRENAIILRMKKQLMQLPILAAALVVGWMDVVAQTPNPPSSLTVEGGTSLPPPPPPPTGQLSGLDWNGTGTVKRGLYWTSAVPDMAPLTVLMKKYPRILSATDRRYYADFFWGNHAAFQYGAGYCNAYVGFHPYPRPNTTPQGNGHWELAVGQNFGTCTDVTTRDNSSDPEISWNRWHSQALTVRNTTGTQHEHKLYVDLPSVDTANTITVTRLSDWEEPPTRSIMIGQTGDNGTGKSWGGEPRWEETNAILRGIQIYSSYLTQQQILSRSACDTDACVLNLNSSEGVTSLWYLNMNPTPSDVSDKSGRGHHGVWDGSARPALWTN
jgi:hypothetical protein